MATELVPTQADESTDLVEGPGVLGHVEASRAMAEVKAALAMAVQLDRNETRCIDKITAACQRTGLAQVAMYCYSRGGQEITGPSIGLMEVIAQCWGHLQFGFRELEQANGKSTVECYAWDLVGNTRRSVIIVIPHARHTKAGSYKLTDPRDIYEHVANFAQRRVRSCLEAVIPQDVIDGACQTTRETLLRTDPVTTESIAKLLTAFEEQTITREQLERRLGRRLETITSGQLVHLRTIYASLRDGMSTPATWFAVTVEDHSQHAVPKSAGSALKARKQAGQAPEPPAAPTPKEPAKARPAAPGAPDKDLTDAERFELEMGSGKGTGGAADV